MLKSSFKLKLVAPVVIILVVLAAVVTISSTVRFSSFNEENFGSDLLRSSETLLADLKNYERYTKIAASESATDPNVIAAVEAKDSTKLKALLNDSKLAYFNVDYFTIADAEGTVIVRTYSDKSGDSVAGQQNVKDALTGKAATYYESGTEIKVSVRSGAPVYNAGGDIIGVISAGFRLDTEAFVNYVKKDYHVDATVFADKIRVATTISGALGKPLDNQTIIDALFSKQQQYSGDATILGESYKVVYTPLKNPAGDTFAILFIGEPYSNVEAAMREFMFSNILIAAIVLVIAIVIMIIVANRIGKPILELNKGFRSIAAGNLGTNIHVMSKDEIGQMGKAAQNMIAVFRRLIDDTNKLTEEWEKGNTDFLPDTSDYVGDYKEFAAGVIKLATTSAGDTQVVLHSLLDFSRGNFSFQMPKMPGKKAEINNIVETMRDHFKRLIGEIGILAEKASEGQLSVRINEGWFEGGWESIAKGLNTLLDNVAEPIHEAKDVLGQMAVGDLTARVKGEYKGDFAIIKTSINTASTTIHEYIGEISHVIGELADDNLDQEVTREYVGDFGGIKESLNHIVTKLNDVMKEIGAGADQVASGAKHMADSSMALSMGATTQASSVEELEVTIKDIYQKTSENANLTKNANKLAENASISVKQGTSEMERMLATMSEINQASANISKIIKIIEDIAFQTNLLALNAAVEAARAGQHGRGFAVVADQVRNLAARSQESAKETADLIDISVRKVAEGTNIAKATSKSLSEIVNGISEITSLIDSINSASEEQTIIIGQVNSGISQIADVTQTNTAASQEAAAAGEELASQSDVFKSVVSRFKLKGTGSKGARSGKPAYSAPVSASDPAPARSSAPSPAASKPSSGGAFFSSTPEKNSSAPAGSSSSVHPTTPRPKSAQPIGKAGGPSDYNASNYGKY